MGSLNENTDQRPDRAQPLLRVSELITQFRTDRGDLRAVDGVSFDVPEGRTVGLVGESGCGKSVTALSILRLLPQPVARISHGTIELAGRNLLALTERAMCDVRGNDISMIFQEPMTSLNPVYTVGWQIIEAIQLHQSKGRRAARERAIDLLRLVGIPAPETQVDAYPHQLSGGMRQRAMIAMALACEPRMLIADEPTTALDVTIQAQILELLRGLQDKLGMSILLITHDLAIVAEYAHEIVVMYAGQVVEQGSVAQVFERPRHPYTRGLMQSLPRAGTGAGALAHRARLPIIEGMVPDLGNLPKGCRFADRCSMAVAACTESVPPLEPLAEDATRRSRCFRKEEL